jgi:PPOX class probable F420-dependent enzyme
MRTTLDLPRTKAFPEVTGKYVSLTTYRRIGAAPVATPVWFVTDGERLLVRTDASSGKVKRLRRDPRVTLATCTARGKITGRPVEGTVEIEPWGDERIERLFGDKYRVDLLIIRPIRALQKLVQRRRFDEAEVLLKITRS